MKKVIKKLVEWYRYFSYVSCAVYAVEIICKKCGKSVLVADTYYHSGHKDGLRYICKKCDNKARTKRFKRKG